VRTILVREVRVDADGRLLVVPDLTEEEDLAFIYRAAMGIGWDRTTRGLVSPSLRPGGWSYLDWFHQTLRAVADEYGARLLVGAGTKWFVPDDVRHQIEKWCHETEGKA